MCVKHGGPTRGFVVRIIGEEGKTDFKAFGQKADAENRFYAGWNHVDGIDGGSSALFEVIETTSAPEAVTAVKTGRPGVILLKIQPQGLYGHHLNLDGIIL